MDHLALVTNLFYRCSNFHYNSNSGYTYGSKEPATTLALLACRAEAQHLHNYAGRASIRLLVAVDDSAAGQIVRRKLHCYLISSENPDEILAHLAGNVRQDLVLVFQLNAEHRVGQWLDDRGHDFNGVFLGVSGIAFLFFLANGSRHKLLSVQTCQNQGRAKARPLQNPPSGPALPTSSARSFLSAGSKSRGRWP